MKSEEISNYLKSVRDTNKLPDDELLPVLYGLFGEVGSLMTAVKKNKREPGSYTNFRNVLAEEFGDVFWYLCCLASRLDIDIESIILKAQKDNTQVPVVSELERDKKFDNILIKLGQLTSKYLDVNHIQKNFLCEVPSFLKAYYTALSVLNINFDDVIRCNRNKTSSRFLKLDNSELPTFDKEFPKFERLPESFEIEFLQRTKTQHAMRWNGVFIGDPLTDSIGIDDQYRFHDVFHFAFASILHWSPTFRSLIKHKRKNNPKIDSAQDGGRAIVVEEGLSAWIFSIAKEDNFFADRDQLTFDILKNVERFVKGFEVESCPLSLWEKAILEGYKVFRQVRKNKGGVVVGNRENRTLIYREGLIDG